MFSLYPSDSKGIVKTGGGFAFVRRGNAVDKQNIHTLKCILRQPRPTAKISIFQSGATKCGVRFGFLSFSGANALQVTLTLSFGRWMERVII